MTKKIKAFSNGDGSVNKVFGLFTGIKWQCVEFVRRWYIINFGVSFDDIKNAYDIIKLQNVYTLTNHTKLPFYFSIDFDKIKLGDILIFKISKKYPNGHVAVVTKQDEKYIYISEQNYNFQWENKNYSRRFLRSIITDIDEDIIGYKTILV